MCGTLNNRQRPYPHHRSVGPDLVTWYPWILVLHSKDPGGQTRLATTTSLSSGGIFAGDPIDDDGDDGGLELARTTFDLDLVSHRSVPPTL